MGTFLIDNVTGGLPGAAIPDTDSDGLIDTVDACDTEPGDESNNGCPIVIVPVTPPTTPSISPENVVSIFSSAYTSTYQVAEQILSHL